MDEDQDQQDKAPRIPRCPECAKPMHPAPYGWWACPDHPWRMAPDRNNPWGGRPAGLLENPGGA